MISRGTTLILSRFSNIYQTYSKKMINKSVIIYLVLLLSLTSNGFRRTPLYSYSWGEGEWEITEIAESLVQKVKLLQFFRT